MHAGEFAARGKGPNKETRQRKGGHYDARSASGGELGFVIFLQVFSKICDFFKMQMHQPEKLQLMEVKAALLTEAENEEKIIKTYRQYKQAEIKKQPGVHLCDRHQFFMTLGDDKVAAAQRCLLNPHESIEERINTALLALKLAFEVQHEDSYGSALMSFTLKHDHYACFFVSFADTFWKDLYTYFCVMLDC